MVSEGWKGLLQQDMNLKGNQTSNVYIYVAIFMALRNAAVVQERELA